MKFALFAALVLALTGCASAPPRCASVSILNYLEQATADRTLIVESSTAYGSGLLYVADRVTGNALRIDPKAPLPVVVARVEARDPSGLAFDAQGVLQVLDTARGALWKVTLGADGKGAAPVLLAQDRLLEGADGLAFDRSGRAWVAVNELNAVVAVTPTGAVQPIARNGSAGPLEFPSAIVFVSDRAYMSNFDVARRDNLDVGGTTSRDGVGASIAQITP